MGLQATGQGDGTQVDPGDLTEVRRWIWEDKADRNKGLSLRENREGGWRSENQAPYKVFIKCS